MLIVFKGHLKLQLLVFFVSTNPGYQGHVIYRALLVPEVIVRWVRHTSPFLIIFFSLHFLVQALGISNLMDNKSIPGPWAERSPNKLRAVRALQQK